MRIRDVVVVRSSVHEGTFVPGIVVGSKLATSLRVIDAFRQASDVIDELLIPHSFLVLTREGLYQVHHNLYTNQMQARMI